ncbi:MAG TPA: hypothetical protein VNP73_07855 [Actinomycetota bacterium]|nr:hypothetical protein [Actinomycetota bacterium]
MSRYTIGVTANRARELTTGIALLALTGSSVGGFLGMVMIATRALGR